MYQPRLLLLCCFAFGCTHRVRTNHTSVSVDTTFTFVASTRSRVFPQVPDSTRVVDGSVLAAAAAPPCAIVTTVDTLEWSRVSTDIPSRFLSAVRLWLPPGFAPYPSRNRSQASDESQEYWEHILGSWDYFKTPLAVAAHFALWIGPTRGYPTSGISGDSVEQVAFSECKLPSAMGVIPVALFTVQSPSPHLGGHYVVAYWEVRPGAYLRAMGIGPDSVSQAQLLAALATVQLIQ